jgi:hypothetical protein
MAGVLGDWREPLQGQVLSELLPDGCGPADVHARTIGLRRVHPVFRRHTFLIGQEPRPDRVFKPRER